MAIMEALALGLPVVATRAGGVPVAVGDAGILTPIGDPAALAAGFVRLAEHPDERARFAGLAAERAAEFSIERAVAEIGAVYDEAIAADRRRA